ncbi:unnamed protein product [Sphenostylis stenocarpa]|uniref:Interferon-related developmental regulator N-terminal domain-containing protein n=1 Tax=Sphenostylis stenocarpa TaxID=92480 RepID=A0AA86TF94_9FABA|nr:unnamed protein product [Sphenostylis stenocarpa]
MLDSDDDSSSVSSSSTSRADHVSVSGNEEVHFDQDALLDQALDALDEKRGSTRETALSVIVGAFSSNMQDEFVDKKFATLLHQCLASIKKGSKKASAKEIALASQAIGLLSLTVGCGDNQAREIFEETTHTLDEFLTSKSDLTKNPSFQLILEVYINSGQALSVSRSLDTLESLGDQEETERSMDVLWRVIHPRLGSNVVAAKPSAPLITAAVSSWSFLLSSMRKLKLNSKNWQNSISYLSSLLDKEDRSVRIAAGEALALIFENGIIEKFSADSKGASEMTQEEINLRESNTHLQGLKRKVINQVKNLSVESGGKGSAKKDLNNQRNLFRDIVEFFEIMGSNPVNSLSGCRAVYIYPSQTSLFGSLVPFPNFTFWESCELVELSQALFRGRVHQAYAGPLRMFKSPNSVQNKARTQLLNKQRLLSEGRNLGHYAASRVDDEVF